MTQELNVPPGARVLEIGTGSGYQATVLAEPRDEVHSIEIIGALAETAEAARDELAYTDVHVSNGDGTEGWPEQAPFDAIIVTAAPDHVFPPLLAQLGVGGVMIVPVGPVGACQVLRRITRTGEESYESVSLGGAQFVPLTRQEESP
jgi:protein-L-isoaspartate(D-aspartate) O-methyltransferase